MPALNKRLILLDHVDPDESSSQEHLAEVANDLKLLATGFWHGLPVYHWSSMVAKFLDILLPMIRTLAGLSETSWTNRLDAAFSVMSDTVRGCRQGVSKDMHDIVRDSTIWESWGEFMLELAVRLWQARFSVPGTGIPVQRRFEGAYDAIYKMTSVFHQGSAEYNYPCMPGDYERHSAYLQRFHDFLEDTRAIRQIARIREAALETIGRQLPPELVEVIVGLSRNSWTQRDIWMYDVATDENFPSQYQGFPEPEGERTCLLHPNPSPKDKSQEVTTCPALAVLIWSYKPSGGRRNFYHGHPVKHSDGHRNALCRYTAESCPGHFSERSQWVVYRSDLD